MSLKFSDDGINAIAKIAHTLNTETANVGARRLKTVMAKLLEDLKFDAHKMTGKSELRKKHFAIWCAGISLCLCLCLCLCVCVCSC